MTQITYRRHEDLVTISLDGHAEFNPGNDVVCASISTMTYQLLNTLDMLQSEGKIKDFSYDFGDGRAKAGFRVVDENTWSIVWKVISIGYENIADQYPNNLFIDSNFM